MQKANISLKTENQILKKENENLKNELANMNLKKNEEIKKINEKFEIINEEKMKNIANLILKLNSIIYEPKNYNELPEGEKLIALNFISVDQRIIHSII